MYYCQECDQLYREMFGNRHYPLAPRDMNCPDCGTRLRRHEDGRRVQTTGEMEADRIRRDEQPGRGKQ